MKLLVAGDFHGDPKHTIWIMQEALNNGASDIFQVGDFGYWEHLPGGRDYLDMTSQTLVENDMRLYFIDGNHENHTLLRAMYSPTGPRHEVTPEGFWIIRPNLFYVPRGTRWVWNEVHLMGLGGAYSVDKDWRIAQERKLNNLLNKYREREWSRRTTELKGAEVMSAYDGHTLWWPDEELTDEEVLAAIEDPTPVDILFTHDKPRQSNPDWNRKDLPECWPNQDRVQTVVQALRPSLVVHGHLHHHYVDTIQYGVDGGADSAETVVIGLDCNPDNPKVERNPADSYIVLNVEKQ